MDGSEEKKSTPVDTLVLEWMSYALASFIIGFSALMLGLSNSKNVERQTAGTNLLVPFAATTLAAAGLVFFFTLANGIQMSLV